MKATEAKLLTLLQKSPQFIIPIYQRTYSWSPKQCQQLWDDILRAGSTDDITVHFIGSIVYVEQGLSQVSHQSPLLVIDGQQRLTTVTLLIEALARAVGTSEPVDGFSAPKLRAYYLSNHLESGDRYFKLLLSQTDSESLKALISNSEPPRDPSLRISENFEFFTQALAGLGGKLDVVCRGLAKLVVVDVALSRSQDNPQLIFESMNSTGKELSQADLIRNFVLMSLEPALQTKLYEQYWRPMELDFGQEAYGTQFDGFMRHYLIVRSGEIPRERDVYEAFKDYARSARVAARGVEALVADIRTFARYFCAMALDRESQPDLAATFRDLREFKVDVAYPFLLVLYHDYKDGVLTLEDFVTAARMVESYIFRRAICNIPSNSLNKTFATFERGLKRDRYLESIAAHFLLLPSYRRFPGDDEFILKLRTRDLYNFPRRSYWLRRMENHGRKERVPVEDYTIEHILPQNPELSADWQRALGPDWKRIREQWLHTLGNLTLTGYNAEYSDRPFTEKRDMAGGFAQSPLRLNAGLGRVDEWNESAILVRGERLSGQALAVWPAPNLEPDILSFYRGETTGRGQYTIEDHQYLAPGSPMRTLFDSFRREVLALDPCITEEFLKLYVAYKAETNFVDVVPQKSKLRLTINMRFQELRDPRGRAKDVTNLGRWGNGDVEVALSSAEELPYILGLVRQGLEKQLDSGEASD